MRKILLVLSAALGALLLSGCAVSAAAEGAVPTPVVLTVSTPKPAEEAEDAHLLVASQDEHPALMDLREDGSFAPAEPASRRELCRALARMLLHLPADRERFSDLRRGSPDYAEASALCAAGVMTSDQDGAFRPEDAVTRGELSAVLRRLENRLSGPAAERASALAAELSASEEMAEEPITRAELARALVRLAGRTPDEAALLIGEHVPADADLSSNDWPFLADAVTEGVPEPPGPGVHRAYGWLYAVWEDGALIRDMDVGVWTFGLDGRYTTGDAELDGYLRTVLEDSGANELEGEDALAAAYLYVKYYGEYLVRPEDMEPLPVGATGWEYDRAVRFFRYGGGTCYGFAAAFGLLARALGEHAYIVSAEVNQYHGAHAFVVIPEDGQDYIYDVELEATRQERHADLDLFRLTPTGYYHYWYDPDWG